MLRVFLLSILAFSVRADDKCIAWAQLVEQASYMQPEERERMFDDALKTAPDRVVARYVMTAKNWLDKGLTVKAAWLECASDAT